MTTRDEIITALLCLGEEKGLTNVSLADIADEVGIRKASIYSHFSSQSQMIEQAISYCRNLLRNSSFSVDFKAKDAKTLLTSLFDSIISTFAERPVSSFFSVVRQMYMFDRSFAEENRQIESMISTRVRIALEFCVQRSWLDIRDTDYAADLVTAAVIRNICDVLSSDAGWETDNLADNLLALFGQRIP